MTGEQQFGKSLRPDVYDFDNSPEGEETCVGYGAVYGQGETSYGHDIIKLSTYPPEGEWARNHGVTENVVIVSGRGGVAIRGVGYLELDALAPIESQKRAVTVHPGQWFRWQSDSDEKMVISMLTSPAFYAEQYETQSEESISFREELHEVAKGHLDESDFEFLEEFSDVEGMLSYIYGRLLDLGKDADEILKEYNIIEQGD